MFRLVCCLFVAIAANAATPLFQASFEKPNSTWTVVRGSATPDASVLHEGRKSLRVEPGGPSPDACVRFAPVSLTIGRRYELSGWARTEDLVVRDLDRSPIAVGAALAMASMPFDVHSESLGGTQPWTRLTLRFVATRAQDQILLTVANGGAFQGKAWFEGVTLDEASFASEWPVPDAVRTFGPAYRYPAAGWIYLHIEGQPYERGYQHGYLMAREIPEYLERCAADLGSKADASGWDQLRTVANALFLRGFDREILEEMRGIADGASDAGASWLGRPIDLVDIVVANVTVELGELRGAIAATPTGLEGLHFDPPAYFEKKRDSVIDHCSAFAATGPATRDGKMVIGHVTWWPLTLAEQTNVMLDIQPATGHRVLMQSYPGGIESGTDWYQNDAGVVLTETTIRQTPFNAQGTPVAFRARMAIQYGGNIDEVVERLGTRNNGLYTNEWLLGDAQNNEIAMYELGTNHTRLWRSSKNEWFGDTPGFYWGDNNAKDLAVRLETQPDPHGTPEYVPYVPGHSRHGMAGSVPPVSRPDRRAVRVPGLPHRAAGQRQHHGRQNRHRRYGLAPHGVGRHRQAQPARVAPRPRRLCQERWPVSVGLLPVSRPEPPASQRAGAHSPPRASRREQASYKDRLWKGWVLPASDADTWFAAGSAAYYRVLQSDDLAKALDARRAMYRGLKLGPDNPANRFRLEETKGVLFLDSLRRKLGDDRFFALMSEFFAANAGATVTAQSFLEKAGVPFEFSEPEDGPAYLLTDIYRRLRDRHSGLRHRSARRAPTAMPPNRSRAISWTSYESAVPIYKDFEVSDELLRHRDVIFIGRPEANSALAAWAARIGLDYPGAAFRIDDAVHASEREALLLAATNPLDPRTWSWW